jgi:hypothetical protein
LVGCNSHCFEVAYGYMHAVFGLLIATHETHSRDEFEAQADPQLTTCDTLWCQHVSISVHCFLYLFAEIILGVTV